MKKIFALIALALPTMTMGQDKLPYYEIPEYPEAYTATAVVARMVDGLGFRYYWATQGLGDEDLQFKPSPEARSTNETLDHIHGLVEVILNSVKELPNSGNISSADMAFADKRALTLEKIKAASDILKASDPDKLKDFNIVFQRGSATTEYPFWNQLNGPIADAIWHVGQIVTFRRSSGNPITSNVSFLSGKLRK